MNATMKTDIIFAGVSGQGVLTLAALVAQAAMDAGLHVKQSEPCGCPSHEGGSREVHVRLSDKSIFSDQIPRGQADLLLGLEPVETLRQLPYLAPDGWVVTATAPLADIPDYPPAEMLMAELRTQRQALLLPAAEIARNAGAPKFTALVVLGAAATIIPVPEALLLNAIRKRFDPDGTATLDAHGKAFAAGRARSVPATRKAAPVQPPLHLSESLHKRHD